MEQKPDLSQMKPQNINPETFRRVWERVMPNQENSPIVLAPAQQPAEKAQTTDRTFYPMPSPAQMVATPAPQPMPTPAPRPMPTPAPQPMPTPAPRPMPTPAPRPMPTPAPQPMPMPAPHLEIRPDEERLCELMDMVQEGIMAAQGLAQRSGNHGRMLSGMATDHRRAMKQLSTAYFLATGQRYHPKTVTPILAPVLALALRGQFLWEQRWATSCLRGAKEMEDAAHQELCQELAQDAALHNRTIRAVLERM